MYTPKPFNEEFLPEEDGHKIYYAQYGNPDGEVIVFIHGGPGANSKPKHAQQFDLDRYQVVLFDQRGCGQSTPAGSLEENNTGKIISDMERLREQLGIEKWFVSGSSWGSTLALLYAQAHPEPVKGLLVTAIYLSDKFSNNWAFHDPVGTGALFTDAWEERKARLAEFGATPENAAKILAEKLQTGSLDEQQKIAALIMNWEVNLLISTSDVVYEHPEDMDESAITFAKVWMHYEANNFFVVPDQVMNNISAIKDIPVVIIHGRQDILCPFEQAWKLHKAHPNSKLVALPQSNHQFSADGTVAKKYIFESFLKDLGRE